MIDDLYTRDLLRLAAESAMTPPLDAPDSRVVRDSQTCGSRVTVDVCLDAEGRVVRYGHAIRACAIGQAAAALVARRIIGLDRAGILEGRAALAGLLKTEGAPLPEAWSELIALDAVRDLPTRHEAALLCFDALLEGVAAPAKASSA